MALAPSRIEVGLLAVDLAADHRIPQFALEAGRARRARGLKFAAAGLVQVGRADQVDADAVTFVDERLDRGALGRPG